MLQVAPAPGSGVLQQAFCLVCAASCGWGNWGKAAAGLLCCVVWRGMAAAQHGCQRALKAVFKCMHASRLTLLLLLALAAFVDEVRNPFEVVRLLLVLLAAAVLLLAAAMARSLLQLHRRFMGRMLQG